MESDLNPWVLKGCFGAGFALALALHWLWCLQVAYPLALEKYLRRGRAWIYIPLNWEGARRWKVAWLSRIFLLAQIALGVAALVTVTRRATPLWIIAFAIPIGVLVLSLHVWWLRLRFLQQEDLYFRLHDEISHQMKSEGKLLGDAAYKNLASFKHQNLLRKADQEGALLKTLSQRAKEKQAVPQPQWEG